MFDNFACPLEKVNTFENRLNLNKTHMKTQTVYESPLVAFCDLELEGFLCQSTFGHICGIQVDDWVQSDPTTLTIEDTDLILGE